MKKEVFPGIVLVIFEVIGLIVILVSNFNTNFTGGYFSILCILSSIAIIRMEKVGAKLKAGMALGFPFKYFVFSVFIFVMPKFGTSGIPVFVFAGLLLTSIIGTPIAFRFAVKR